MSIGSRTGLTGAGGCAADGCACRCGGADLWLPASKRLWEGTDASGAVGSGEVGSGAVGSGAVGVGEVESGESGWCCG